MAKDIYILGISAFYHDSAAALIKNGEIVAAIQEERFSRIKNDFGFPCQAIRWILTSNALTIADIDHVIFYEKPFKKFERIIESCIRFAPRGFGLYKEAIPLWLKNKLFQKQTIKQHLSELPEGDKWNQALLFSEHHFSHSAAAFFPSPFESAAIITVDGVGEWGTTTISVGNKNQIEKLKEINYPHSIGLLYSAFTAFLGFKVNSGEYKMMGLAPYGVPKYTELIKKDLIDIKGDGSYRLNMRNFSFATALKMFGKRFEKLFGISARQPESELNQIHMDIAASIQQVTDELFVLLAQYAKKITSMNNLCLGGGVALNCASAGHLLSEKIFDKIWIQPSAGDAGSALGAALAGHYSYLGCPRSSISNYSPFLGAFYDQDEINHQLDLVQGIYHILEVEKLIETVAEELSLGKIVGWMQGAAEFSPRALGNRSILADPRVPNMKKNLNAKIKFRESFRPFAPAILEEDSAQWFEMDRSSPLMNFIFKSKPNISEKIPSVIHVDKTARVQTVSPRENPLFYRLIKQFKKLTDCPVLINTSFNRRGEPIVLTPTDAFNCFMKTGIDTLVIGSACLKKEEQMANSTILNRN
jgi:carbamoyltransferase